MTWAAFVKFMQAHPMDKDFARDLQAIHLALNQPIGSIGVRQDDATERSTKGCCRI